MSEKRRIGISEYATGVSPDILITYGLGSCLGILLYDGRQRLGGLAHTLLPAPRPGQAETRPGKFVTSAIELMLAELLLRGAERPRLAAKIFGGANMFEGFGAESDGVGVRNTRAARDTLAGLGIPLLFEDVGGQHGRTVEFELASGIVQVRSVRGGDIVTHFDLSV